MVTVDFSSRLETKLLEELSLAPETLFPAILQSLETGLRGIRPGAASPPVHQVDFRDLPEERISWPLFPGETSVVFTPREDGTYAFDVVPFEFDTAASEDLALVDDSNATVELGFSFPFDRDQCQAECGVVYALPAIVRWACINQSAVMKVAAPFSRRWRLVSALQDHPGQTVFERGAHRRPSDHYERLLFRHSRTYRAL